MADIDKKTEDEVGIGNYKPNGLQIELRSKAMANLGNNFKHKTYNYLLGWIYG